MSEENKRLIKRWFAEVWNQGNKDVIDELLAEDGVINGLVDASGNPVRGISLTSWNEQAAGRALSTLFKLEREHLLESPLIPTQVARYA